MDWLADGQAWIALVTLIVLEIVLGIDNIIFISIVAGRLPAARRASARTTGLAVAVVSRVALLVSITWVMRLTTPLFEVRDHPVTGRDLILIAGGMFLLGKATTEIHARLEGGEERHGAGGRAGVTFSGVILQILLLDVVFSLDSVITAVGMASQLGVMITAVITAVMVMLAFAGAIGGFVDRHPTLKMLALSFLLLIGVTLVADGLGQHIPKGYIYFAMAFSFGVEMLNLRLRAKPGGAAVTVALHQPYR